jgi:cobalamin biosynthesis protein CobT|tara:strand:+ start:36056 stop:37933 length:1878 start_codon:yes stop_codon:yes gene_type:complete
MKVSDFVNEMRGTSVVFGRETGVYVTFEGDQAYTDGKRINLPSMGLDKTLTSKQVKTMRGYVDHEAGHIRHSDMPLIMDFYSRCGNNGKMELKALHNCIEDVWMEHKVVSCYSGSLKNLAQTNESVAEAEVESFKDPEAFLKKKGWSQDKITEALAMTPKRDLTEFTVGNLSAAIKKNNPMYSSRKFNEFKEMLGEKNNEWAQHFIPMILECKNSQDTIDLAMDIWKMFEDNSQEELEDMQPEDFEQGSGEPLESVGEPGDEEVQEGYGKGKPSDSSDGEGEGQGVREVMPEDYLPSAEEMVGEALRGENTDGQGSIGNCGDGPLTGGYKVATTEYDTTYKKGGDRSKGESYVWDIIESSDMSKHNEVMSQIAGPINVMSGKLRRALLAKKRVDRDSGRQIGRLDSKRLVAASQGADNVFYQRVDRKEEDTAVTILGDLSGSMGGRKAVVTRDCIVALSECLEGGTMPFKIVGFCNKGYPKDSYSGSYHRYEPLDTVVFKDYTKPLRSCRAAVAQFDEAVGGNNSDYDFITQEITELKKRPEQRKVLFVLSDGHPACQSDASTSEHVRLCKEAIDQARKEGIECVGIGICDEAVKEIYKDHVVVHDVKDLSATVFNKLTNMLVGD